LLSRHKPMNVKCKIHSQNCLIKMHTYRLQMSEMHIFKTFHKGSIFADYSRCMWATVVTPANRAAKIISPTCKSQNWSSGFCTHIIHSDCLLSSMVYTIRVQQHMKMPQKLAIASCTPAILSCLCPQLVAGAKSKPPKSG
jgi:hypothetical protein